MSYDFIVAGAGMFGATFARAAAERNHKILLVEKRDHVGGNCHTEMLGKIPVHVYGPHIFHTNDARIWRWVNRFANFRPFVTRNKCIARGRVYPLPFNMMTFHMLWGVVTPEEARRAIEAKRLRGEDDSSVRGWVLANLGREVYETFVEGYTWKQWGRDPATLPASIVKRLPIRFTYDDDYFSDRYQGVPQGGYGPFFEKLLAHPNIEVKTNTDYMSDKRTFERLANVVYSGRVDEYHDYRLGPLAFRSCTFDHHAFDGDQTGQFAMYYCDREVPYTRTIEHKHLAAVESSRTIVTWETPFEGAIQDNPLYPVLDRENLKLYDQYQLLSGYAIFAGRLGSYRYFDMHHVVAQALSMAERLCG